MIQDFFYYLREYGISFVWDNFKAIVFNDQFILHHAEEDACYEPTLDGVFQSFQDLVDLGYIR